MNKKVKRVILIIIYALLVVGISYVATYYIDKLNRGNGKAIIGVTFDDTDYYVIPNSDKLDKEKALLEWPYMFTIKNSGTKGGDYQILISDDEENDLKKDNLRYVLLLDDKEVADDKLNNIKDGILYTGKVLGNSEQRYKLYIYKYDNSEGKNYKYTIKLKAIVEGGPGF